MSVNELSNRLKKRLTNHSTAYGVVNFEINGFVQGIGYLVTANYKFVGGPISEKFYSDTKDVDEIREEFINNLGLLTHPARITDHRHFIMIEKSENQK